MTTATPRKVRSDARLEHLTPAQHALLLSWLEENNFSYSQIVSLVHHEFGLRVGRTAVAAYWRRHVQLHRYQEDSEDAETLADLPQAPFDEAAVKWAERLAWAALSHSNPQLETATRLLDQIWRAKRASLALRRMELDESRFDFQVRQAELRARRHPPAVDKSAPPEAAPLPAPPSPPADAVPTPPPSAPSPAPVAAAPVVSPAPTPPPNFPPATPLYSPYFALIRPPASAPPSGLEAPAAESGEKARVPPEPPSRAAA